MKSVRPFQRLRHMIVMIMAVVVVMAPMSSVADTSHMIDEAASVLDDPHAAQNAPEQKPSHTDGHDHVAHHCGSCHIHMMDSSSLGSGLQQTIASDWGSTGFLAPMSLHPDGLYRPPRV